MLRRELLIHFWGKGVNGHAAAALILQLTRWSAAVAVYALPRDGLAAHEDGWEVWASLVGFGGCGFAVMETVESQNSLRYAVVAVVPVDTGGAQQSG